MIAMCICSPRQEEAVRDNGKALHVAVLAAISASTDASSMCLPPGADSAGASPLLHCMS